MASQSDTPHLQLRQNPTSRISLYLEEQVLCGPGGSVSCHFLLCPHSGQSFQRNLEKDRLKQKDQNKRQLTCMSNPELPHFNPKASQSADPL